MTTIWIVLRSPAGEEIHRQEVAEFDEQPDIIMWRWKLFIPEVDNTSYADNEYSYVETFVHDLTAKGLIELKAPATSESATGWKGTIVYKPT